MRMKNMLRRESHRTIIRSPGIGEEMTLADFRRLCVEYGQARANYLRGDISEDFRSELRLICDKLWTKIVAAERDIQARWPR